jgi:hypothetical protein
MKYESDIKPVHCPNCNSKKIADILYGHPIFGDKLNKDLEEGKIVLGGCLYGNEDPTWMCIDCNIKFYKPK